MKILILYATYSGGTQTASQIVIDTLKIKNHELTSKVPSEINSNEFNNYDLVVMCTPTWDFNGKEGQPHEDFMSFMEKCKGKTWENTSFAIMGLGDSSYTHFCGSVDVLESFVTQIKGKLLIPSLRIDGFFYDQQKNSELIKKWTESIG
jgi:flavodoxin I